MQCQNCGAENRPEVRFCRKCGQLLTEAPSLQGPTSVAAGPVIVCPSCGATVKAGGRFCPRCGGLLGSGVETATSRASVAVENGGSARTAATPEQKAEAVPDYRLRPVPASKTGPPQTLLLVLIGLLMVACVISGVVLGVKWLREGGLQIVGGGEPTTMPIGVTPTPSPTVAPTDTPPQLPPVLPPTSTLSAEAPTATLSSSAPSATPTLTPTTVITPSATAEAGVVDLGVELAASSTNVRIAEATTLTVTVTNTGEVALGRLRYSLEGAWDDLLVTADPMGLLVVEDEESLAAGEQRVIVFRLEGRRMGLANIWAGVTFEVQSSASYLDRRISRAITIVIMP